MHRGDESEYGTGCLMVDFSFTLLNHSVLFKPKQSRKKKSPPSLEALHSGALGEIRTPYPLARSRFPALEVFSCNITNTGFTGKCHEASF